MAEFAYNNAKKASTNYTSFKLNCGYHLHMFFEEDINSYFKSYFANGLAQELNNLIMIYSKNLFHT